MTHAATSHAKEPLTKKTTEQTNEPMTAEQVRSQAPIRTRCKVHSIDKTGNNGGAMLELWADFDPAIREDQIVEEEAAKRLATIRVEVTNPRALAFFELGKFYVLEFTKGATI
ncbi:MAG TPA: hypothetical protein VKT80_09530 [Chloroflexota bacterium]|nr:hypothetical protein [Chloroflexota bacterium]